MNAPRSSEPSPEEGSELSEIISIRDVRKVYDTGTLKVRALRGVSLTILQGDFVAIMGASGSGKSTLMNILGCLDVPTSGKYLLDGVNVRHLNELELARIRNQKIGFVFQSYNLVPRTTAVRNVELPLVYGGVKPKVRHRLAIKSLKAVGLARFASHLPSELSGGMQQRVTIARAMVTNPAMILADEPTGALDTVSSAAVMQIFSNLSAAGRTVVIITHEPDVAAYAKRIIEIRDGLIIGDRRSVRVESPPPLWKEPSLEDAQPIGSQ
ncbi:MAG TPA: ABC transporter ATP-binding protein [Acidimicrobiales bacterium]|nr:ABC transporter ATP-binding protein [Acidimicrobiales bacterium]